MSWYTALGQPGGGGRRYPLSTSLIAYGSDTLVDSVHENGSFTHHWVRELFERFVS